MSLVSSAHCPLSLLSQIGGQEVSEEESCRPSDVQLDGGKQCPNTSQSVLMSLVQLTGIVSVVWLTLHGKLAWLLPKTFHSRYLPKKVISNSTINLHQQHLNLPVSPPYAAAMYTSRPELFMSFPIQPMKDCMICIPPGWIITFWNKLG